MPRSTRPRATARTTDDAHLRADTYGAADVDLYNLHAALSGDCTRAVGQAVPCPLMLPPRTRRGSTAKGGRRPSAKPTRSALEVGGGVWTIRAQSPCELNRRETRTGSQAATPRLYEKLTQRPGDRMVLLAYLRCDSLTIAAASFRRNLGKASA
jgi:hypothetical protein